MVLASLVSTSQTGSLELLATQLNNPPALANNSGSTVTVSLTATGQWALINFATSDPSLVKYKTPVDGNGHVRDKNDEKFGFKYPNLNPGALVGEIKDAKGNTKSTVSGKQQSFELQPGDTISFVINDDPKWYADNTGKLTIAYSAAAKATQIVPTAPGVIANLYNTGVDDARQVLGDSIPDPHYKLATYPAGTVTPGVTTPNKDLAPINWVANTKTARWIGPNTASAVGPVGNYSYITTFTLPNFSEASIVGELSVDDNITDIVLNGVSVGKPVALSSWWTKISRFSISTGFVVGTNTLEFKLHSIGGPTGLRIDSISGTYKPLKATVYEHANFQGISKELLPGSYGIGGFGLPNDTLSSLKVDKGLKVTLYEHGDGTGRSKTFTSDAAWVGDDFNDITSNIKVELVREIPTEQLLSQKWVQVPNSGSVIGVTVLKDGTILGIGMDNYLWTRATLNSSWVQVPNSGSVIGVTVLQDGTILGIGMDKYLWTRATLNSSWVQVPNSGSVIGVTVLKDGTILGIGMDNYLWTKGI